MKPVYRKIALRLVPFLMLLYVVSFLDRVNISFAALTMNRDLGIGEGLFGLAAGLFFLGYFLFEVPSNLALERVGARRWLAAIMVCWGVVSVGTAFVPGRNTYLLLRFLLGIAESGFYPGVILYLTFWLPAPVRSTVMAIFVTAIPISNVIGSPVSAQILQLDHFAGLKGWQWLFLLEGFPSVVLGALVLLILPDRPAEAAWLSEEERQEIRDDLRSSSGGPSEKHSLLDALAKEPSAYGFSFAYFTLMTGLYGLGFWTPKILSSHAMRLGAIGWWTALPYAAGAIGMILWSRHSDRRRERVLHLAAAYLLAACGFAIAGFAPNGTVALAGLTLTAIGIFSAMPIFWSSATLRLSGGSAGAYIAAINSIGNLGGFVGPIAMGWLRQWTHSYAWGLWAIAGLLTSGAFAVVRLVRSGLVPRHS
jgi:ACS family tartrate transporter-like MFS transporter